MNCSNIFRIICWQFQVNFWIKYLSSIPTLKSTTWIFTWNEASIWRTMRFLSGSKKAFSIKVRLLTTVSVGSSRPTASCHLQFTLKNPTESSSIHTWAQMTTDDIHKCHAVLLYRAVCLRIAFKKKVERNWKMITMLHSVEGQASCTDERYLFAYPDDNNVFVGNFSQ